MHPSVRFLVVLITLIFGSSSFATAVRPTGKTVPGEVLVRIESGATDRDVESIQLAVDADKSERVAKLKSGSIWRMHSRTKNAEAIAQALAGNANVAYVEPNYVLYAIATPNDPSYAQLWGLKNTGQSIGGGNGLSGADIDAEAAWNLTTGSASIVVGVVDTGVNYTHPDLAANIWSNPGGIGGCAAGTHGFNAITNTCDPMDDHYHGSHVAGTIGAAGNNSTGVAGVNWTTSIMGLKFLDYYGYGTTAGAIAAIDFAIQAKIAGVNVRVLSNSWGGGSFSKALLDVINKANENDILFVAAAGNDSFNNDAYPQYPANYATPNMISVAATDYLDNLAYFSNYGLTTVHLGAPGVSVYSTSLGSSYTYASGTSMAAPHVSGVAALLLALSPSLTTAQVKSAILNNVDPIDSLAGRTVTGGRLNAARTLGLPAAPDFSLAVSPTSRSVAVGTATSYALEITPLHGFNGAVTLSASGLPAGATAAFAPNPATTTSTLTITTTNGTPLGGWPITVTGAGAGHTHNKTITLTTLATLPPPVCPQFTAQSSFGVSYEPTTVATGDFNRDGRADFAVNSTTYSRIAVFLGTPAGSFLPAVYYSTGSTPISIATADVNGDGALDLVTANVGAHNVSVLLGNGAGTFQPAVNHSTGSNPFWVVPGDFNRDGHTDLAVANNGSSNVSVLIGNGDGEFAAPVHYSTGSGPFWVSAGDLNRDGALDIAVATHNADEVAILIGNGDGTFQTAVDYATGDGPSSVAIADFNRDGNLDLAVSNYNSNNVSILKGLGDGTFLAAVPVAIGGTKPYALAAVDVNIDGKPDLVTVNSASNNISTLLGAGDATFGAPLNQATAYNPNHVAVDDFNRDGRPDLAVANVDSHNVWIFRNTGTCSMNCASFAETIDEGAGNTPESLAAGDFDRDGKLDLVVANSGSNNVSVILADGEGSFNVGVDYNTGLAPRSVKAADVNRDGKLDLVVANSDSDQVSILLGNGNGTFQGAVGYDAGNEPRSVDVADIDRDGALDVVVANSLSDNVSVLFGNGDGTFDAPVNYDAGDGPAAIVAVDLNRDGIVDLAVANETSNNASVLIGNSDGSFDAAMNIAAGTSPRAIVAGDLNRDGKPDLAVANGGSNNVSVFYGNGNGTLQAAVNYGAGTNPSAITLGDFNDDGISDIAVANQGSNNATILFAAANGTFENPLVLPMGTSPKGILAADVTGDAKPDLITANNGSHDISIAVNTCPVPDLVIAKVHTGNFNQGDAARTYTLTVTNAGAGPTEGIVNVIDTLPIGLTATALSGSGWTCNHLTLVCTRIDVLAGGASYPPITLTVKVANNAPASVTNAATVSGGNELNSSNSATTDPTTVAPLTDLMITKTHAGSFSQGATGRVYTIVVRNAGGLPATGTITVTDTLPTGLTATAISGTGWNCTLGSLTCTRNDVLGASSTYPAIKVTVNVAANAPSLVTNVATVSGGGETNTSNSTVSDPTIVWSSQVCGAFGQAANFAVQGDPWAIAKGDFDNDGRTDLALTNYGNTISVLLGNGNGTFDAAAHYTVGSNPQDIAVADMNEDGNEDLVVLNNYGHTISILLGYGDGTFAAASNFSAGSYPLYLALGDYNGDGHIDIAVTQNSAVRLFLGNGNGTVQTGVNVGSVYYASNILAADVNADSKLDLVVASSYDIVSVLIGNGDGTFQTPVPYLANNSPSAIALGDLNADGKLDLVVGRYSFEFSVLIGNGDGTFQTAVTHATWASSNHSVVLEDLDGDGALDLAINSSYGSYLYIHAGNGDGTFGAPILHYTGFSSGRFLVDDFNADGKPDLAHANITNDALAILLGGCADLIVEKTHVGNFKGGGSGMYTLKVKNIGNGGAFGTITLTDTLPTGLTLSSLYGYPWTCNYQTKTCLYEYGLPAGGTAENVLVYVNVAADAPTNVVNTASVSGGGDSNTSNNTDTDPTTITYGPDLVLSISQSTTFPQGATGRNYTIWVSNHGNQPTSGTVTVTATVPAGLTPTSMAGTGWNCNLPARTCTRNDSLPADFGSYGITVNFNVDSNSGTTLSNTATVSVAGDVDPSNNTDTELMFILTAPANLQAVATTPTQVAVTWNAVTHAGYYEVTRSTGGGVFTYVGTSYSPVYIDGSVVANTAYIYQVRASGGPASRDLATTTIFTDNSIQSGITLIKRAHIEELRTAVNAMRSLAGLSTATFTDPTLSSSVKVRATHLVELRNALNHARSTLGVPAIVYTDPSLSAGVKIKAAHINELRNGVK